MSFNNIQNKLIVIKFKTDLNKRIMKYLLPLFLVFGVLTHFPIFSQPTYLWSNGATTATIDVNPVVTTTYNVTITDGGFEYYESLLVTVNNNSFTPTISTTQATCTSSGTATITNFDASNTYTFSPAGPTIDANGQIIGLVASTSYTVPALNIDGCLSEESVSFSVDPQLLPPTTPIIASTPATCFLPEKVTISNYDVANIYTFSPSGPTLVSGGLLSGFSTGITYTVIATNGNGCVSEISNSFSVDEQLETPAIPILTIAQATCEQDGKAIITNYDPSITYTFSPTGPTVGVEVEIIGFTPSKEYTITATNSNGCSSFASSIFSIDAQLTTPSTPIIASTAATCNSPEKITISNYNGTNVYTFTPSGPYITSGGLVNGLNPGTNYSVIATSSDGCISEVSASFSVTNQFETPNAPIVTTSPSTCLNAGIATITNYVSTNVYTFSPAGPTVGVGGLISGLSTLSNYTVTATNINGCTSIVSTAFKVSGPLARPDVPSIVITPATCSQEEKASLVNYISTNSYTFSPSGPTVNAGGTINGLSSSINYTVISTNTSGCSSIASPTFSVSDQLAVNTVSTENSNQTVCINTALTTITLSTTGATGIGTANDLPTGVTATWSSNQLIISGTPTNSGTFNYSIPLTGGCGSVNATGTITVTPTITPIFTQVGPYLEESSIPALPTTSTNNITGTWSPELNNTASTTYTFTPTAGQCANETTMTITISEPLNYTLTANDSTICAGTTVTLSVTINPTAPPSVVYCNGVPTAVVDVINPITGRTWMDRNLGASQAATSSSDANAYGDLYQWGRGSDGHQCRNSATTSTLSSTDQPGHDDFILAPNSPSNWRSTENINLWQGVNGVNNPCPIGYRLPTTTELTNEKESWNSSNSIGAFTSPLKLTLAGIRWFSSGTLFSVNSIGHYWTSNAFENQNSSSYLSFNNQSSNIMAQSISAGRSVRCIKGELEGTIDNLDCGSASNPAIITQPSATSGVIINVSYTGGNGGSYNGQSVNSTNAIGLTANLNPGTFANGSGNLTFIITGTIITLGLANFELNIGGQTCTLSIPVGLPQGTITSLNCGSATNSGTLTALTSANNFAGLNIPYTGGNGGTYSGNIVASTGVTGLTATLNPGSLFIGSGNIYYTITGIPSTSGTAYFNINFLGQSCTLSYNVQSLPPLAEMYSTGTVFCANGPTEIVDVINPLTGRTWMDRNLGASQTALFSSNSASFGDLYQWGRKSDGHQCRNSTTTTVLSSSYLPNHDDFILSSITGEWQTLQNDNLWQGVNGVNNPCPIGYRLPSIVELNSELLTWSSPNATSAFTSPLKLPAAGFRTYYEGLFGFLGTFGYYWSSSISGNESQILDFASSSSSNFAHAYIANFERANGASIRCIKDAIPAIGNIEDLNCSSSAISGTLVQGVSSTGVNCNVSYLGGNGSYYSGQTINSTGVSGLTAALNAGIFANGAGILTYIISGTPSTNGTAIFALNVGGQTCTLSLPVALPVGTITALNCGSATISGTLNQNAPANTVSFNVPYSGGNSGTHNGQTINSTGITGLTATLTAGTFASGSGNLTYVITGTPTASGTADFALTIGGRSCSLAIPVGLPFGIVTSLNCGTATNSGTLTAVISANNVSSSVPYSGGNGGIYVSQSINSTGVTGLTATLNAGTLANGSGSLIYTITGTPSANGTANFALSIGGQTCNLTRIVEVNYTPQYPSGTVFCSSTPTAIIDVTNPTTGRVWMDRNLGASQVATSSTDVNAYGDLYQWGRKSDGHQCRNSATSSTLSSSDQPTHGNFILAPNSPYNWRSTENNNLWQGVNGVNNPCPIGYRIPSDAELNAERFSWSSNNSVGAFTSPLKFTLSGRRNNNNGLLSTVGTNGYYWNNLVNGSSARSLGISNTNANMYTYYRSYGLSVRCIKH